jgi:xanthine dehydrogenase accessory factor
MTSDQTDAHAASPTGGDRRAQIEHRLQAAGEPYARATVVRREPPVSATVGDRAIVTSEGDLHGWIGGVACAQSVVVEEGRAALAEGTPRLIGIAPDPDSADRPGLSTFPMRCHSEGVLELFIEPVGHTPRVVVVGGSPIATAVVGLLEELSAAVVTVDPDAESANDADDSGSGGVAGGSGGTAAGDAAESAGPLGTPTAGVQTVTDTDAASIAAAAGHRPLVVVATMGAFDVSGILAGLEADADYIGLVASRKRAGELLDRAAELADSDPDVVAERVTTPAGLDIGASRPAEIALSIVAELVAERDGGGLAAPPAVATADGEMIAEAPDGEIVDDTADRETVDDSADGDGGTATAADGAAETTDDEGDGLAIDPVCGMRVDPATASATATHAGETYYFCCQGCADSFSTEPESYLDAPEGVAE